MQFAHLGAAGSQMPDLVSRDSDSATNSAATTMTFSSMTLGPIDSRRDIVVVVASSDVIANSNSMTAITLAGASPSQANYLVNDSGYGNAVDVMLGVAYFDDVTNTTADVVATFNTTLSTSGSTYAHVFSVSKVPNSWDTSGGSADAIPNASGSLQPAGTFSATTRIALAAAVWEGSGGTAAWSNASIEHANLDVGDTTNGFRVFIGEDERPISGSSVVLANDGWVSGDAACGRTFGFYET